MATVTIAGFDDLLRALQQLPAHLTEQAGAIVQRAADATMAEAGPGYPRHDGDLANGLRKKEQAAGRFGVAYQVQNTAPHSWWFEHGTEVRHTTKGANRGAMFGGPRTPPGNVFIPAAERARATMIRELIELLRAEGFEVHAA